MQLIKKSQLHNPKNNQSLSSLHPNLNSLNLKHSNHQRQSNRRMSQHSSCMRQAKRSQAQKINHHNLLRQNLRSQLRSLRSGSCILRALLSLRKSQSKREQRRRQSLRYRHGSSIPLRNRKRNRRKKTKGLQRLAGVKASLVVKANNQLASPTKKKVTMDATLSVMKATLALASSASRTAHLSSKTLPFTA